VIIKFNINIL